MKNQTEVHFKLWYSVLEVVVVVMTSSAEGIYILASWGLILNRAHRGSLLQSSASTKHLRKTCICVLEVVFQSTFRTVSAYIAVMGTWQRSYHELFTEH